MTERARLLMNDFWSKQPPSAGTKPKGGGLPEDDGLSDQFRDLVTAVTTFVCPTITGAATTRCINCPGWS